ncbi:MAG: hypothetical protein HC854_14835 [Flavobacterium sp.]|nr:hypothetical protein [Flavobacterium sp.]
MKNFKKLSREELKSVFGGQACTLTVKQSDGSYITYSGTCDRKVTMHYDSLNDSYYSSVGPSFCNTGDGVAHTLTSNGGKSRC